MRSVVALALLVGGGLGRASGSKRPHYHRPTAVLLGVRQAPGSKNVSLDSTTDKLQGVLDAVTLSVNAVRGSYSKVKDACLVEVRASSKRVEAQAVTTADLATTRQLNIERTAGLEASLANLVSQETDAHASYESSVSQRATALQKHLSTNKATTDQANAIGKVLEMMKQKKAQITASQTSTEDMKVVPPTAPTSSGSGLDFVIGVLGNIKDTSTAKAEEGSTKHNEDDVGLERLVTSYKTSLQHIDKQYQTENARRMEAKVAARDSGEEKTLRNMLVDGEEKLGKDFFGLCGADGKGGSVPAALAAADFLLSQFEHQSASAINIMEGLPDLVASGAASFVSIGQQQLRGAPTEARSEVLNMAKAIQSHTPSTLGAEQLAIVPAISVAAADANSVASTQGEETGSGVDSAQESAARWVMSQAAKFKDNATQQLANAVAASFPNGVPVRKLHPVRAVVPTPQLHTLVGTDRTYQTVSGGATPTSATSKTSAEIVACVTDKQELTDKIIAARQAARVSRTDRMSAAARVKAVKSFKVITEKQKGVLSGAQKSTLLGWQPMRDILGTKTFASDVGDAVTEMGTILKEVENYIKAGGPPASAGLPTALAGITKTLKEVQTRLLGDMEALQSIYTGKLMISYPALINQLVQKGKNLDIEESAMIDAEETSNKAAIQSETAEKDLMVQRAGVEYRCLREGQCGNLHYQQCCSGGVGTFTKKVSSWEECAEHCEGLLKDGKQIAGCQLTGLAKKDDRSGSGTCIAQTACSLKPSTLKCAGSLCKAAPAKK